MAVNGIVQCTIIVDFSPTFYCLPTKPLFLVWFDGTIIDISIILLTMYNSAYVLFWLVALHGD